MTDSYVDIRDINREYWVLYDGDGDRVEAWLTEPEPDMIKITIESYKHPDCGPFVLRRLTREAVWEYQRATMEHGEQAYQIFGKGNTVMQEPIVKGKRKVTLR
jgi:hypothetical protein